MRAVLISIQPEWSALIANGEKTIEIRKTIPKIETPFKCYIYCTKDNRFYDLYVNEPKAREDYNCVSRIRAGGKEELKTIMGFSTYIANGKVIGEFVCDKIDTIGKRGFNNNFDYCYLSLNEWGNDDIEIEITDIKKSCISKKQLNLYGANSNCLYAWHISNLKIYDKPKELGEFQKAVYDSPFPRDIKRPPQSWCYVEELNNERI